VCARHRFEDKLVPLAREQGWPSVVDWAHLVSRVEKLKDACEAIIQDTEGTGASFYRNPDQRKRSGQRLESQFLNFQTKQAGYYGEIGFQVISSALVTLFPDHPLSLVQSWLLPETVIRLIMEDQQLVGPTALQDAFDVSCASATYGAFRFPD
ncbi:hypothetical protein C8J56DRAFT_723097, partial [Mycena floridula]